MPPELLVTSLESAATKEASREWPSWDLTPRQTCDLELMLNGGFAPLDRFMGESEAASVDRELRLQDGTFWPLPVTLEVSGKFAESVSIGNRVALRDLEGVMLAALEVDEIWESGGQPSSVHLAGPVRGLELPGHHDYRALRHTPAQLSEEFNRRGWRRIVAHHTHEPMHRAEFEMTRHVALEHQANLLLQPVVGFTRPGARDHFGRVRCYQALLPQYPAGLAMMSLLPLSIRPPEDRMTLLQAVVAANFGCTHFIAPANPAAATLLHRHHEDVNVEIIPHRALAYSDSRDQFLPEHEIPPDDRRHLASRELESRLAEGREIPRWFTFPEVAAELRHVHPPRARQGFTIFFTGLSGSGKSTAAKALLSKFLEIGGRSVTLLDGDIVRKNLSSELGFSREHRNLNILRIGFVANEITKNGGIAICAPIAPYDTIRREVRNLISQNGGFVLVHLSTPLEVCEHRDRKGLYAKARAGVLKEFTGISDPYETPKDAEVVLDTDQLNVEECCQKILLHLGREGYLGSAAGEAKGK